jgi:hypothetical protein
VNVNPLLMTEGDLLAVAAGTVFYGCFPIAMTVRVAATMRLSEHEVLFAGDAAAPNQGRHEEQRKKRTEQRPQQFTSKYNPSSRNQILRNRQSGLRNNLHECVGAGVFPQLAPSELIEMAPFAGPPPMLRKGLT